MSPEPKVSYIGVIPSSREAKIGKPLNVLGGVRNDAENEYPLRVTLWGRASDTWKELISQEFILTPKEHKHLYFTIPEECLEPAFWDQEDLPEIELLTLHKQPADSARGILIFVKK
ncbi:MAG: hypothetical protein J6S31_05830 [Lachnospiraceae bacterium]|nr:hypothetical protein [Lachnospiraceae bacterium]